MKHKIQERKEQLELDRHGKRLKVVDAILGDKERFKKIGFTQATRESVKPEYRYKTSIENPNKNLAKINLFDSSNKLDKDMENRMGIGTGKSVESAAQDIHYVRDLDLESITEYLQSRKYLHGRYLEENGSISISTHPIFKFKDNVLDETTQRQNVKYLLMNDYIRKEEKQTITQNEFQSEMVKSSYLSVNVRANVFAFCFGASVGYGAAWSGGTMDSQSSSQAKIFESTQFIRATVTITPKCLEYTGMYHILTF